TFYDQNIQSWDTRLVMADDYRRRTDPNDGKSCQTGHQLQTYLAWLGRNTNWTGDCILRVIAITFGIAFWSAAESVGVSKELRCSGNYNTRRGGRLFGDHRPPRTTYGGFRAAGDRAPHVHHRWSKHGRQTIPCNANGC